MDQDVENTNKTSKLFAEREQGTNIDKGYECNVDVNPTPQYNNQYVKGLSTAGSGKIHCKFCRGVANRYVNQMPKDIEKNIEIKCDYGTSNEDTVRCFKDYKYESGRFELGHSKDATRGTDKCNKGCKEHKNRETEGSGDYESKKDYSHYERSKYLDIDFTSKDMGSKPPLPPEHCKDHSHSYSKSDDHGEPASKHFHFCPTREHRLTGPFRYGGDADKGLFDMHKMHNDGRCPSQLPSTVPTGPSAASSHRTAMDKTRRLNEARYIQHFDQEERKQKLYKTYKDILPSANETEPKITDSSDSYAMESELNLVGLVNGSEDESKSNRSSKTVISQKSSARELRKMVMSQCKLHEVIDETLKQFGVNPELGKEESSPIRDDSSPMATIFKKPLPQPPVTMSKNLNALDCQGCMASFHCHRCQPSMELKTEKNIHENNQPRFDQTSDSYDDVVNSKVVNPMMRKLQRMYMNNLKEEMSLMEDLESLPHKLNEVYQQTTLKPK